MSPTLRSLLRFFFAICVVLVIVQLAHACPTCKDGLAENDPQQASLVKGYFYSILFMMAMPFVILGTFGSFAYLSIRRAQAANTNQEVLDEGRVGLSGTA